MQRIMQAQGTRAVSYIQRASMVFLMADRWHMTRAHTALYWTRAEKESEKEITSDKKSKHSKANPPTQPLTYFIFMLQFSNYRAVWERLLP